jgi:hypothetical protein
MLGTVAGAGGAPRLPRLGTVVGAGADPALPRLGAIAGCAGAPRLPRLGTVSGCGGAPRLPRLGTVTGGGGHTLEGEAAWARRSAADVRQANTIRMSSSNVDATARSRPRLIRAPDTHRDFHAQSLAHGVDDDRQRSVDAQRIKELLRRARALLRARVGRRAPCRCRVASRAGLETGTRAHHTWRGSLAELLPALRSPVHRRSGEPRPPTKLVSPSDTGSPTCSFIIRSLIRKLLIQ